MDLLYSRYSNPMSLVNNYINQGRFGVFVSGFLEAEMKRKKEEAEKDNDWKLWVAYIHTESEKPFGVWKNDVCKTGDQSEKTVSGDENLDDAGILSIMEDLFPNRPLFENGGVK